MADVAIAAAQAAADKAFEEYLDGDGAAIHVPDSVIRAAQVAYAMAGGRSAIAVRGWGNRTHPVISIRVFVDKARQQKLDLAATLEKAAKELRQD